MKRKAYVAIHHLKALLICIVRQPSNFNLIKESLHNLHTNFTGLYKHFACNRGENFEVFCMACSGLGKLFVR